MRGNKIGLAFVVSVLILGLALFFIPSGLGGLRQNESAAVGTLRHIWTLQNEHAGLHPNIGFACQLRLLKPGPPTNDDRDTSLLTSEWSGYRIALVSCTSEPDGQVRRYQMTAVPIVPGKSGVRAFCMDQSGVIWFDANGSAENCLATRRGIS